MKLLLTTPDALIDKESGKFFPGILNVLNEFNADKNHGIVVVSRSGRNLDKIPDDFNPLHLRSELRGSPKFIDWIKRELKVDTSDILILGCKDKDVQQAANSKLILLRADYADVNNPTSMIYTRGYGIPISGSKNLKNFLDTFKQFDGSWYYTLQVSDKTVIYALTNANTKHRPLNETALNNRFKACLKDGDKSYRTPFMVYFLVSTYAIVKEFEGVDYWGTYPSSGTGRNADLDFFKDKARQSYKGTSTEPIFIRTKAAAKRHFRSAATRIQDGCDDQLDSIILNPYYKKKLKGKTVCIIDDFTTYGTSCETARVLLESAGAEKVIFITLGKFGRDFYKYDYTIEGDPFVAYTYKKGKRQQLYGKFNDAANFGFIKGLGTLMQ